MNNSTRNKEILCDYCGTEKIGSQLFSVKKQFAGLRIADILQTVTKLKVPATLSIKICSLCASTLYATTATIQKAEQMLTKYLPKQVAANSLEASADNEEEGATVKKQTAKLKQTEKITLNKLSKSSIDQSISDTFGSPTKVLQSPTKQKLKEKHEEASITPSAIIKKNKKDNLEKSLNQQARTSFATPNQNKDNLDDSLQNAVIITPVNETPNKNKSILNMFGGCIDSDSEPNDEDDEDNENEHDIPNPKPKALGFECKLCDYAATNPTSMKQHLKKLHDQKRPRVFNCTECPKSFGVLKSLNTHLLMHGIGEPKHEIAKPIESSTDSEQEKPLDPTLAVLTALNSKPGKPVKNALDTDYTFAIENTNSSTPKPATDENALQTHQCSVCNMNVESIKKLQEHMKDDHQIDRPKLFKCSDCPSLFMYKKTMDRHVRQKHGNEKDVEANTKPKPITKRRKTIAIELGNVGGNVVSKKTLKRRKTITIEADEELRKNIQSDSPLKRLSIELDEGDLKSPLKKTKQDDIMESSEKLASPSKKKQSQAELKNKDNHIEDIDLTESPKLNASTTKETKSKSPKKSKKSVEIIEASFSQLSSPSQTMTVESVTPSKLRKVDKDADIVDTSQIAAIETNGTPKADKQESSQAETADESFAEPSKLKSGKKTHLMDVDNVIELIDEINTNVKPHKRAMLQSITISESELSCSTCGKSVNSRKRLDSHILKKHTKKLKCSRCEEYYFSIQDYVTHFMNCNTTEGLPCGVKNCDKVFEGVNYLTSHLNKKHKNFT